MSRIGRLPITIPEGVKVDIKGFEALMEKQRVVSKQGSKIAGSIFNAER